jgi:hypothetical protein
LVRLIGHGAGQGKHLQPSQNLFRNFFAAPVEIGKLAASLGYETQHRRKPVMTFPNALPLAPMTRARWF